MGYKEINAKVESVKQILKNSKELAIRRAVVESADKLLQYMQMGLLID